LLSVRTVGVMGDARTYDYMIALRAVTSIDAMTADWAKLPHELLEKISTRIVNEVKGVNRVVYDITQKPLQLLNTNKNYLVLSRQSDFFLTFI